MNKNQGFAYKQGTSGDSYTPVWSASFRDHGTRVYIYCPVYAPEQMRINVEGTMYRRDQLGLNGSDPDKIVGEVKRLLRKALLRKRRYVWGIPKEGRKIEIVYLSYEFGGALSFSGDAPLSERARILKESREHLGSNDWRVEMCQTAELDAHYRPTNVTKKYERVVDAPRRYVLRYGEV